MRRLIFLKDSYVKIIQVYMPKAQYVMKIPSFTFEAHDQKS